MKKKINLFLLFISLICIVNIVLMARNKSVELKTVQYDVLIGIVMSTLFYFIVDYYPQQRKILAGYKLIQVSISRILASIETILSITKSAYEINGNLEELVLKDWKVMFNKRDIVSSQYVIYTSANKNRKCKLKNSYFIPAPVMGPNNLNDLVKSELNVIKKNLDEIFTYESYFVEDSKMFGYLTKLRNSSLFENYTGKYDFNYMSDTYSEIYELQKLYFAILKYNLHYYEGKSIIDTSKKAIEYQQKFNTGKSMEDWLIFMKKKEAIMNETERVTYYKFSGNHEYAAKEFAQYFDTKLIKYTDKEILLNNDLNIIVNNFFNFLKILTSKTIRKMNNSDNLVFFVIQLKLLGLFINKTKRVKIKKLNVTLYFIPASFKIFGKRVNKENPTIENLGIIRQEVDKQFNEKYDLFLS